MSNDNGTSAIQRRGLMLVLSSPSGAGKTTLSRQLLDNDKEIQLSVSCTTRARRPSEKDGVDYSFIDAASFRDMIERGAGFLALLALVFFLDDAAHAQQPIGGRRRRAGALAHLLDQDGQFRQQRAVDAQRLALLLAGERERQ